MASTTIRRVDPAVDDDWGEHLRQSWDAARRADPKITKKAFAEEQGCCVGTLSKHLKQRLHGEHVSFGSYVIWVPSPEIGGETRLVFRGQGGPSGLKTTCNLRFALKFTSESKAKAWLGQHRDFEIGCNRTLKSLNPFVVQLDEPGTAVKPC